MKVFCEKDGYNKCKHEDMHYDHVKRGYRFVPFNSNTNNSGPDDVEPAWSVDEVVPYYNLSADDEQYSDNEIDQVDKRVSFGFNNANVNSKKSRGSKKWFQRNMFDFPNDESDFSGAISGDEQYDIAPLPNSNILLKPKLTKNKLRKSTKFDIDVKREDSIICSPVAVISYFFEFIWRILKTIMTVISRCLKCLKYYFNIKQWYLVLLYLLGAVLNTLVHWFTYSVDKIFGLTCIRRWLSPSKLYKQPSFYNRLFSVLWLLLWVAVIFIIMHFLLIGNGMEVSTESSTDFSLEPLRRIVEKDCMEINGCCSTKWILIKRFVFYLTSLLRKFITFNNFEELRNVERPHITGESKKDNIYTN